jgi:hypothetical protein
MEQQPPKDERREIARRLFKALCTKFPDRYVILIESRDVANRRPFQPTLEPIEASAPSVAQ